MNGIEFNAFCGAGPINIKVEDNGRVTVKGALAVDAMFYIDCKDSLFRANEEVDPKDFIVVQTNLVNGEVLQTSVTRSLGKSWWRRDPTLVLRLGASKIHAFLTGGQHSDSEISSIQISNQPVRARG